MGTSSTPASMPPSPSAPTAQLQVSSSSCRVLVQQLTGQAGLLPLHLLMGKARQQQQCWETQAWLWLVWPSHRPRLRPLEQLSSLPAGPHQVGCALLAASRTAQLHFKAGSLGLVHWCAMILTFLPPVLHAPTGDLRFEDVSLRYFPGGPLALRHVSFHVQSCEQVRAGVCIYVASRQQAP